MNPAGLITAPDRLYIGGEWVRPSTEALIDVINPSTEEVFLRVAEAQDADIRRAVAAAREAFDEGPWRKLSHAERGEYVRALGRALRRRSDDIVHIWTSEMGITREVALGALEMAFAAYEQNANLATSFAFEERHRPMWGGELGLLVREPVGVVGAIIPWNAPPVLIAYKIAPALVAGCTVVLKASPEAPGSAYFVAQVADEIGLPKGVFNVVTADRTASESLVRDPNVDKISFTGSSAAGRRIASICGERVARFTLELGGKSAGVVLDDCDVGTVADAIGAAAPTLTGQVCCSVTRLVIDSRRHDDLVSALSERFRHITVGDPFAAGTGMGPLAMRRQRDRVEYFIAAGKSEGAQLACGGGRPAHMTRGFFIEPTVFGKVDNTSTIAREEIFGPVISVIPARDERDALRIANDTIYGLNASVFTRDAERAYQLARELRSGTVGQNAVRADASIAFGGFKQSGIGREGGIEGLLSFLETKTIILDGKPRHLLATREPSH